MAQIVDVPGVGRVEFPSGMSDSDIAAAIQSMAPAEKRTAADETGGLSAFGIAAGRKTDSILDGLTQMYLRATGDEKALSGLDANVKEKAALYQPLKDKYPLTTSMGEAVPAMTLPGRGLAGMFAAGAAPELLSYGSLEERLRNAGTSGAGSVVGGVIGKGVGRLLKPAGQGAAAISDDAAAAAQRVGFQLTPGQVSQNPAMLGLENYLARSPGSSGRMQTIASGNQAALNRAAASAIGQKSDDLSEGVFAAAKSSIGKEFDRLQSITSPQLGNDFLNTLAQIDAANAARGSFKNKEIDGLINKGLDLAVKGKLTGTAYKEIRSELSSEASKAFGSGDATLGQAYKQVRKALDAAAEQSLSAADRKAWGVTRQQWQAYKQLSKSNVAEAGNVSAPRLAAAVRREGDALRTGAATGPLADVARIGEAVKGVPNPTSGQLVQMGDYASPTLTGLLLAGGNKATAAAYMNPAIQRYLSRGLLDIGPNGQILLEALGRPAGVPLARSYLGAE